MPIQELVPESRRQRLDLWIPRFRTHRRPVFAASEGGILRAKAQDRPARACWRPRQIPQICAAIFPRINQQLRDLWQDFTNILPPPQRQNPRLPGPVPDGLLRMRQPRELGIQAQDVEVLGQSRSQPAKLNPPRWRHRSKSMPRDDSRFGPARSRTTSRAAPSAFCASVNRSAR